MINTQLSVLQLLEKIDKYLFLLIHRDADFRFLDGIMLLLRNPLTWIPFYLFLAWHLFKTGKQKIIPFIIVTVICVLLTDRISAGLCKPFFGRLRPCYDPDLQGLLRNIINCGGQYSFPSSHAANHFGLATCWYWSLYKINGKKWWGLYVWAAAICYAQVYVGKHFPFDVLAGAGLGWLLGIATAKLFEWWTATDSNNFFKRNRQGRNIKRPILNNT